MSKRRSKTKDDRANATGSGVVPTLKTVDYLGIKHDVVRSKMNTNVEFKCYMSVTTLRGDDRFVAAVYYDSKPNRELKHDHYMLLFSTIVHSSSDPSGIESRLYVTGRSQEQIDKDRIHHGLMCLECGTVCVSLSRHHFHGCDCPNNIFVDGGQEKWGTRFGAKDISKVASVKVDMLTGEIKVDKPRRKR